jgi:hypothetical protein
MTDEELIETLWSGEVTLGIVASAADRIEQLVKDRRFILDERDRTFVLMLTRAETAEARVTELEVEVKAARYKAVRDYCIRWNMVHHFDMTERLDCQVLEKLEKTE